ncbi:MAG TPA: polymer-forming cytoskeletal protein [Dehalococcoidia bacterium]|nr:polymer-forming cytoskeletal protein [Dehalococcoidia bacterium]
MTSTYTTDFDPATLLDQDQPFSRLDRFSRFDGRYEAMQNLLIEGTCTGEIDCRGMLVVAEGARVNARIFARDMRIAGYIEGQFECSGRFELLPTARAQGAVKARQIVVHEGAEYDGELSMSDTVVGETEPAAWDTRPAPPATEEPATEEASAPSPPAAVEPTLDATPEPASAASPETGEMPDFLKRRRSSRNSN